MHPPSASRAVLAACTVVATVATAGSLYFSEVLGLYSCELCWIQRIAMYPLVVVLGVAAYEDRIGVRRTALPLAVGGGAVAAYHSYLQSRPAATCSSGGCGSVQYELLGLLSIPNLSLLAFSLIAAGLALTTVWSR
ncbi:disulfide bond formation protein [Natronomonas moolapensis 8.8.11]|uniref:Disulfide bond formation protein n=1 Tax=Natronomonas moolapensis (strain DSM 18674 / CECT 7526 / JCM 14361 / 8.8.11) TaxID=268739 RepID=M1XNT3_NATM8|nr:disulfide bond formation protein B [Natronomonas moolapensis]CCQ35609.1 disulfide bond formation protein [Natronomonas moolapensis 8.8.11]